MELIPKASQ